MMKNVDVDVVVVGAGFSGLYLLYRLRKAGFSDEDIWDIISVVGFFNMSNRIASGTKMIPNKEYHSAGR